jgi:hypothetical protein
VVAALGVRSAALAAAVGVGSSVLQVLPVQAESPSRCAAAKLGRGDDLEERAGRAAQRGPQAAQRSPTATRGASALDPSPGTAGDGRYGDQITNTARCAARGVAPEPREKARATCRDT